MSKQKALVTFNATRIGLLLIAIPVAFQLVSLGILASILVTARNELLELEHEKAVLSDMHKVAFIASRALIPALAMDRRGMRSGPANLVSVLRSLKRALNITNFKSDGSPELRKFHEQLEGIASEIASIERNFRGFLSEGLLSPDEFRKKNRPLFFSLVMRFDELGKAVIEEEHKVKFRSPEEMHELREKFLLALSLVSLSSVVLAMFLTWIFSRYFVHGLRLLAVNASKLITGESLSAIDSKQDEIERVNDCLIECSRALNEYRNRELAAINNAADVACSFDENLNFVSLAGSSLKYWHYAPEQLLGKSLFFLTGEEAGEQLRRKFERLSQSKARRVMLESSIKCGDGSRKELDWAVRYSAPEKIFYAQARDISAKKELERLKQRFISIVSHDLRTPLTGVQASLALLQKDKNNLQSEEAKLQLGIIDKSLRDLTSLTNDVLDLEKLESGNMKLDLTEVRAYNICAAAAEFLDQQARQYGVRIIRPANDAVMLADEKRLTEAIKSLLANALRASRTGDKIILAVEILPANIEISVTDQSPSLDRKQRALLFQKSGKAQQIGLSPSTSEMSLKSSALSLAVVKAIVEAHGGKVGVESTSVRGNKFWLRLERYKAGEEREDSIEEEEIEEQIENT